MYPVAAWRPRPREPPVTTAVLPVRSKRVEKSVIWDIVVVLGGWGEI